MQQMNTLQDLMDNALVSLYTAEQQALEGLPKLAELCQTPKLKKLFRDHEKHTQQQAERLEELFEMTGQKLPSRKSNPVIAALIREAEKLARAGGDKKVVEAALVMSAQQMEHIEIASYGTAVELAKLMGEEQVANLLAESLKEEKRTDEMLTDVARSAINPKARKN